MKPELQNVPDTNNFASNRQTQEMECLVLHSASRNFKYKMTSEKVKASPRVKIRRYKNKIRRARTLILSYGQVQMRAERNPNHCNCI